MRPYILVVSAVVLIFSTILLIFWKEDVQYSLPTPIPRGLEQTPLGSKIDLPDKINIKSNQPVFLHFFNPGCPCSKFNVEHFSSLYRKYKDQLQFVVILQSNDSSKAMENFKEFNIDAPSLVDVGGKIATYFGVYSTPQAVLVDRNRKLYYRGNYNTSRYCVDKNTSFVAIALDSLIKGAPRPLFIEKAYKAYGCELPSNKKIGENSFSLLR